MRYLRRRTDENGSQNAFRKKCGNRVITRSCYRIIVPSGTSLIASGSAKDFFVDFLVFFSGTGSSRNVDLCIQTQFSHGVSLFSRWWTKFMSYFWPKLSSRDPDELKLSKSHVLTTNLHFLPPWRSSTGPADVEPVTLCDSVTACDLLSETEIVFFLQDFDPQERPSAPCRALPGHCRATFPRCFTFLTVQNTKHQAIA